MTMDLNESLIHEMLTGIKGSTPFFMFKSNKKTDDGCFDQVESYHIQLMLDAGLIRTTCGSEGITWNATNDGVASIRSVYITWEGHEWLRTYATSLDPKN